MAGYPGSFIAGTAAAPTAAGAPGIWRVAEAMQAKAAGNWPAQVTADPLFNYVTLLLSGDGTNGAQNNTFLDASGNNLTITRNGNTTQGSLSPFGDRWSNYFDGSGDTLTTSGTDLALGAGDFTIEYWVNAAVVSDARTIFNFSPTAAGGAYGFFVRMNGTSGWQFYLGNGSSWVASGNFGSFSTNPINGVWQHHAVVRQNGVLKFYINGAEAFSVANTTNITHQYLTLGNYAGYVWWGYISNFRAVKGSALYTSNFTPPVRPLTAVAGTSLLTCHANRFVDGSSNNFTITRNGDVRVEKFSPFSPSSAYTPAALGGSAYFDGTGDFLLSATSSTLAFSTNDFTIEAWVYPLSTAGSTVGIFGSISTGINGVGMSLDQAWVGTSNIIATYNWSSLVPRSAWTHLAVTRQTGTLRWFVNGKLVNSVANSTNIESNRMVVGARYTDGTFTMNGYVSGARAINGTAEYTTTFTPPTAPPTAITDTSLLLNFTNAGIFNSAEQNNLETVGNAQISTAVTKFGTGSMSFDGVASYLNIPFQTTLVFGTGDWTIEGWFYAFDTTSVNIYDSRPAGTQGAYPMIWINASAQLALWVSSADRIVSSTISANQWYHFAFVRSSGVTKLYLDGVKTGVDYADSNNYLSSNVRIGYNANNVYPFNGYIDDFRITKGVARYTDNFTPPEAPFPDK